MITVLQNNSEQSGKSSKKSEQSGKSEGIGEIVEVDSEGYYTINGTGDDGELGTEITIFVNGVQHTTIHTSCSPELEAGNKFGDFTVFSGVSQFGGVLCTADSVEAPIQEAGETGLAITQVAGVTNWLVTKTCKNVGDVRLDNLCFVQTAGVPVCVEGDISVDCWRNHNAVVDGFPALCMESVGPAQEPPFLFLVPFSFLKVESGGIPFEFVAVEAPGAGLIGPLLKVNQP